MSGPGPLAARVNGGYNLFFRGGEGMKAVHHGALSLVAGGSLWLLLDSLAAGAACFFTGLLLDLDHLVDYLLHHPRNNTLADLVDVCENCRLERVVLPLHSWELLLLSVPVMALCPGQRLLTAGIALGLGTHLLADQLSNPVTPRAYLLIHRWRNRFRRSAFFDSAALERRGRQPV